MSAKTRSITAFVAVAAAALAWTACAGCGDDKGGGKTPAPGGGGEKGGGGGGGGGAAYDKAKGTGTVKFTIKYAGAPVTAAMYKMGTPDSCSAHNDKIVKETTEVNANGTLPHAFVWADTGPHKELTGYDKGGAKTLDQHNCVYTPHVVGVMVGQDLILKNSDPTSHNIHAKPQKQDEVNKSQAAGKSDTVQFKKAEEAIAVNCDIHSWMNAYIFSMKHPFFDVSARETGVATISGLYPGKYTFKVWHDTFGKTAKSVEVEVKAGDNEVTVELK